MSDKNEYGEYDGGYTTEHPPHWSRPFIERYDAKIVSCGYRLGSWVRLKKGEEKYDIKRTTTGDIMSPRFGKLVKVNKSLPSNSLKRDKIIKRVLEGELKKYDSFEEFLY